MGLGGAVGSGGGVGSRVVFCEDAGAVVGGEEEYGVDSEEGHVGGHVCGGMRKGEGWRVDWWIPGRGLMRAKVWDRFPLAWSSALRFRPLKVCCQTIEYARGNELSLKQKECDIIDLVNVCYRAWLGNNSMKNFRRIHFSASTDTHIFNKLVRKLEIRGPFHQNSKIIHNQNTFIKHH